MRPDETQTALNVVSKFDENSSIHVKLFGIEAIGTGTLGTIAVVLSLTLILLSLRQTVPVAYRLAHSLISKIKNRPSRPPQRPLKE